jgi:lipoprotein-releasing system ATP-binding protein
VYQSHRLLPEFDAVENVMMPQILVGKTKAQARQRAEALLTQFGLGHRLTHRSAELSGGEQQRVAIARALANNPALILADEPTGNLDPATAGVVFHELMKMCNEHGVSALVATHNHDLANVMTRKVTLKEGKLEAL